MITIAQQLKIKKFPFIINDHNGNKIYAENSDGYWIKAEYDSNGNEIYWETSNGAIIDKRPKTVELTMDEIAKKLGIDVNLLKIKK
jgi:hypothetical protein